jgi:hypothetical protein
VIPVIRGPHESGGDTREKLLRFAIAHEIGHTLWFAPGKGTEPLSPHQIALGYDREIESLCDRFAAALLLPRASFHAWVDHVSQANGPSFLARMPETARRFRVPERAVARRYFYEYQPRSVAVVCVARTKPIDESRGWSTKWCVLPPRPQRRAADTTVPLRGARVIPDDMMPTGWSSRTHQQSLDGRWWQALEPQPTAKARVPLAKRHASTPRDGFVCGPDRRRVYLVLPLQH